MDKDTRIALLTAALNQVPNWRERRDEWKPNRN